MVEGKGVVCLMVLPCLTGDLSVCINAASLAVIDAGIPMKDYVCACTASYIEDSPFVGEQMSLSHTQMYFSNDCMHKCTHNVYMNYAVSDSITDINYIEETARGPALTLAVLPKSGKITLLLVCVRGGVVHVSRGMTEF